MEEHEDAQVVSEGALGFQEPELADLLLDQVCDQFGDGDVPHRDFGQVRKLIFEHVLVLNGLRPAPLAPHLNPRLRF